MIGVRHGALLGSAPPPIIPHIGAHAPIGLMTEEIPDPPDWRKWCPADGDPVENNRYGCCVSVSRFRVIQALKAQHDGKVTPIPHDLVLNRYSKLGNFPNQDSGEDPNQDMMDWAKNPINVFGIDWKIVWARVSPQSERDINLALGRTPLCVTMALPQAAAEDTDQWGKQCQTGDGWAPSEGHETVLVAVKPNGVKVIRTWGMDVDVHPSWWQRYIVQVDCPIPGARPEVEWAGLDLETVLRDLNDS